MAAVAVLDTELGHDVWVGDAAQVRASYVRKQKTGKRDAARILKLLAEGRFPRLWMPSAEQRDILLIHRHKLVEIRTRVKNGLQHLMLNRGVQKKRVQTKPDRRRCASFHCKAGQRGGSRNYSA